MSNKITKILSIVLAVPIMLGIMFTSVFAVNLDWDDITITSDTSSEVATSIGNVTGTIIGVVQIVGVAVAVIMLIVLAIKYISAAPNDKAEIKKHAVVYIVGAVILFAASGILGIIKGFADELNTPGTTSNSGVPGRPGGPATPNPNRQNA